MGVQGTDLMIVERSGVPYRTTAAAVAALGGAGGVLKGSAVLTVSGFEDSEVITATGVTGSSIVMLALAPCADSDENCPEMLNVTALSGEPGTDQITVTATFSDFTSGPVRINWSAF